MIVNNHYSSFFQWVVPVVNRYYYNDGTVEEDYVTEIDNSRFVNDTSLLRVDAPLVESVVASTSIGVFQGCTNLISVSLPNIPSIGMIPFMNCSSLTDVYLPELTSITRSTGNRGAFYGCSSLIRLDLPKLSDVLDQYEFKDCTKLTHLYLDGCTTETADLWRNIDTAPNLKYVRIGITSIGAGVTSTPRVSKTFKAETIVLPECTRIGNYAFGATSSGNTYIKRVIIPKTTSVGTYAFAKDTELEVVDCKTASITSYLFYGCSSLKNLILRRTTMTGMTSTVNNYAFTGTPFKTAGSGAKIYVPSALLNTYKTDSVWKAYSAYFTALEGSPYEDEDWYKSLEI